MNTELLSKDTEHSGLSKAGQSVNEYCRDNSIAQFYIERGMVFTNNLQRKIQAAEAMVQAGNVLHAATQGRGSSVQLEAGRAYGEAYGRLLSSCPSPKALDSLIRLRLAKPELWNTAVAYEQRHTMLDLMQDAFPEKMGILRDIVSIETGQRPEAEQLPLIKRYTASIQPLLDPDLTAEEKVHMENNLVWGTLMNDVFQSLDHLDRDGLTDKDAVELCR